MNLPYSHKNGLNSITRKTERKQKYINFLNSVWELKKLWNMILIVIRVLGTVTDGLIQGLDDLEIRERVETIQTTTLLRAARIQRRVLET